MHAEVDLTLPLPGLSPVCGKPVVARFDGGRLSSDGGILLLAEVERRLGIAERLARCIEDPRAPDQIRHEVAEMIRFRAAIAAGYPDANDCDVLRRDAAFKMAVGQSRLRRGQTFVPQPTMTRLENLPGPVALKRMMAAMVELFCDSFDTVPRRIVLDIDDTEDRAYGGQQLSLFNAHHDSRCFMPIHIYEAMSARPVAVSCGPETPGGNEVCLVLRHVVRAIRARWPRVDILIRGDSHYGRPEGMAWCERNRVGYIFGLAGNKALLRRVTGEAEQVALDRLDAPAQSKVRRYRRFPLRRPDWATERRVIARVEASGQGVDSRFIVTNLAGLPKSLYEKIYCARGQAENLIKAHKLHLASDRTSCTKATANQFRLLLHTAAYWLMHTLRGLAPKASFWRDAQFDTLRLSLIKLAVRVTELVTKIRISLPTGFAYQHGFATLAARLAKLPP